MFHHFHSKLLSCRLPRDHGEQKRHRHTQDAGTNTDLSWRTSYVSTTVSTMCISPGTTPQVVRTPVNLRGSVPPTGIHHHTRKHTALVTHQFSKDPFRKSWRQIDMILLRRIGRPPYWIPSPQSSKRPPLFPPTASLGLQPLNNLSTVAAATSPKNSTRRFVKALSRHWHRQPKYRQRMGR